MIGHRAIGEAAIGELPSTTPAPPVTNIGWRVIDTLLYAVRDGIRSASMNYGYAECEIMDDGRPSPRCGNVFVAIHGGTWRPAYANDRNLYELYDFSITLTMRVVGVSIDRIGDQLIARNIALVPLAQRQGFNAKIEQLRAYLHMNWNRVVLTGQTPNSANDNLAAWATGTVYGWVEPMRWRGPSTTPKLVGGEWFSSEPDAEDVGVMAEMRFTDAKRFQPQTSAQGVFI